MKLKSFGCSFVYGSDLHDCPHGVNKNNPTPSDFSWPALVAKNFNLEYQCLARPGSSNLQILDSVLSEINSSDSVFLINWTWIERFGYFDREIGINEKSPWNPYGWSSIMPSGNNAQSKIYYKYLHSQMRDKLDTLISIKSAIDNLKENKIKFFMTYTDSLIWETQWHTTPSIRYLQSRIEPYVHGFQGLGFIDWSNKMNFEISDKMHPLEDAHRAAADYMMPAIESILHKA